MNTLPLIDWPPVAANALWILGTAWLIAVASYRLYIGRSTRTVVLSMWLACCLLCAGWVLSRDVLWERIVWGVLGCVSLLQLVRCAARLRA